MKEEDYQFIYVVNDYFIENLDRFIAQYRVDKPTIYRVVDEYYIETKKSGLEVRNWSIYLKNFYNSLRLSCLDKHYDWRPLLSLPNKTRIYAMLVSGWVLNHTQLQMKDLKLAYEDVFQELRDKEVDSKYFPKLLSQHRLLRGYSIPLKSLVADTIEIERGV